MKSAQYPTVIFEPIETWPVEETLSRGASRFRADWSATIKELQEELRHLDAERVVIQLDLSREDLRIDGYPRAHATPTTPRVILSFESKHGPQTFPCDQFDRWRDNVRAIALSLRALRTVDRYGVTKHGQQYRGWQALPAPASAGFSSRDSAWAYIAKLMGRSGGIPDVAELKPLLNAAAQKTHPDRGGDDDAFKRVQRATERLLAEGQ